MSEAVRYATAACLAVLGTVLVAVSYGTARFTRASNLWTVLKCLAACAAFSSAWTLLITTPSYDERDLPFLVTGVVLFSAFVVAMQLWMTSVVRRGVVESWRSGAKLPAGVSEPGLLAWMSRHRLELGPARLPIDVTSGGSGIRIEIPVRRSQRDWIFGLAAFVGSSIVCLGAAAVGGYAAFAASSDFAVALFVFLVGMFLAYFIYLRMFARFFLWGAYTLFGWLQVDLVEDNLTVRRRVWGIRLPPFIEIRDVSKVLESIDVSTDASDRAELTVHWGEQRKLLTHRSALFGTGLLSHSQAEAVATHLRNALASDSA